MLLKTFLLVLTGLFLLAPGPAAAQRVNVEVVSDRGWIFPTYPVSSRDDSWRAYVEAKHNARYGIRVINSTDRRVGLVIAVDGRNIISGQRSYLDSSERMYVLSPYDSQTYDGWRTNRDTINRFYFTNEGDSYAGAWDDYSAMGVIAVAVFPEKIRRPMPQPSPWRYDRRSAPREYRSDSREYSAEAAPGTGFGEEEYSSSVRVEFQPERSPLEKHFFKYEWRETLCRKNIISCRPYSQPRENRFWDNDDGYVPPPPR